MFKKITELEEREFFEGFRGRLIHTEKSTIGFWEIDKGAILPEHSHFHEQTTQVTEGELEITVEGVTQICKPGMIVIIPSNAVHHGRAITDCKVMDTFTPVREDYK